GALRMYLEALEEDGPVAQADAVAARLKKLDPDAEIDLDRAIARRDWKTAIDELRRLAKRRPDRKELTTRVAEILPHAGDPLVEGATHLEPYRIDGRAVIRDFERWEKSGKKMEGQSARVLDYAALWVHPDGSSEMLEHEIVRIQSQEAIGKEAEQEPPQGLAL